MGRGWRDIGLFIIRNRIALLIIMAALTVFFSFFLKVEISYDFIQIVPSSDPDLIEYKKFKEEFGEDGNLMIVGLEGKTFTPQMLNGISSLTERLKKVKGAKQVLSLSTLYDLKVNHEDTLFEAKPLWQGPVETDGAAAELEAKFKRLPFYHGLVVNDKANASIIAITVDSSVLLSGDKTRFAKEIKAVCDSATESFGAKVHYSGLPYIRAYTLIHLPKEMFTFLVLAVAVMVITMFLFFRSFWAVFIPLVVIAIVVVWTLGTMKLIGYKITILTCVMPALITVIGIPNAIYIITKFHIEYRRTNNKISALLNVIQKIGIVTVITNLNTAAGFLVLGFSNISLMREFGIIAGISVTITFFISLFLIPIIFSYLPAPSTRQTKHIDRKLINWMIEFIDRIVHGRRKLIYIITLVVTGLSIYGTMLVRPIAYLTDDMPAKGAVQSDLAFLEENYNGVLPFEIVVSPHQKSLMHYYKNKYPQKLDTLYAALGRYSEISRPVSVVDVMKFARQAYLNGDSAAYRIPTKEEAAAMEPYISRSHLDSLISLGKKGRNDSAASPTQQLADNFKLIRIKASIKDVGSVRLKEIIHDLSIELDSLFVVNQASGKLKPDVEYRLYGNEEFKVKYAGTEYASGEIFKAGKDSSYQVMGGAGKVDYADRLKITGTTKIFTKSNDYLISNLMQNMVLALIVIALMMVPLFGTGKMMIISLIPNVIPLLITTAIMGFAGIPLKPSTALIFSMSFGIAIDNSIHYLARYRLSRRAGETVAESVTSSFKDTGMGMIYTSLILLVGFVIFSFSTFGGTRALGQLTTITLFIALFANLFLLPAMIITFTREEDKDEGPVGLDDEEEELEAIKELHGSDEDGTDDAQNEGKVS